MSNNEIVNSFDSGKDDNLVIHLQKIDFIQEGLKVQLSGYLDTTTSPLFKKRIEIAIRQGFNILFFDCEKLTNISSAGIGTLTALQKLMEARNGHLILVDVQPNVYHLFKLLGFDEYFDFKDNFEKASESFCIENVSSDNDTQSISHHLFPTIFRCPFCSKKIKAKETGRFRCSYCKSSFTLDNVDQELIITC